MVMLLVASSLLARHFMDLHRLDLGFDPDGVEIASVALPGATYPNEASRSQFYDELLRRLEAEPETDTAAAVVPAPMQGGRRTTTFSIRGSEPLDSVRPGAELVVVSEGYFRALGVSLVEGRGFLSGDRAGEPEVAIVSRAAAERYWGNESPLGSGIDLGGGRVAEVVGVAADARYELDPSESPGPRLYRPFRQEPQPMMSLVVRRRNAVEPSSTWIQEPVAEIDAGVPVTSVTSMERSLADHRRPTRYLLAVIGGFAGIAALVTAVGLYGLLLARSRADEQATAIRMVLGAERSRLVRARLGYGLSIAALGTLLGLTGAFVIRRMVWAVLPSEPFPSVTLLAGVVGFGFLVAGLASALPAVHVLRLTPSRALRQE